MKITENKVFKTVRNIVALSLFLFVLHWGFTKLNILYKDFAQSDDSVEMFYEMSKEEDAVVVIGSSHVYCGVNPAVFWENSGVACYLFSTSRQSARASYYYLEESLKRDNVKVVYVDIFGAMSDYSYTDLRSVKGMRLTPTKVKAMADIMNDENNEYILWDFFYLTADSSRWQYLEEVNEVYVKERPYILSRGYTFSTDKIVPGSEKSEELPMEKVAEINIPDTAKEYLGKMVELAEQYPDKEVVFMKLPICDLNYEIKTTHQVKDFLQDKGAELLDIRLLMPEIGYEHFCNRDHLNDVGAEMVTNWLADYTVNNFDVEAVESFRLNEEFENAIKYYRDELASRKEQM